MHPESLRRVLALARSTVRLAERQLGRAGLAGCRVQLLLERLRRLAEALEQAERG